MPRLIALIVAVAAAGAPIAAYAQDEDEDELVALNKKLQATIASLPNGLNETPTSDDEALKRIKATLDAVKPRLEDHADDPRLPKVQENVKNLESEAAGIAAGHKAVQVMEEIRAVHAKGQTVLEDKLKGFEAAVAAFQKVANVRWKGVADGMVKFGATLRKQNQDIAREQADLAREQARAAAEVRRAALAEKVRKALDHLYVLVRSGDKLPSQELAELKAMGEELNSLVAGSGVFYVHEHARLSRLALWEKADGEAQLALAEALGATLVAQGSAAGKAVNASFAAAEDWCYLVVGRFAKTSGSEKVVDVSWASKAGRSALKSFTLAEAERGAGFERGACAAQATTLTATAKVDWLGKNGVRWAVLGWERAKVPADLMLRVALDPFDHCDLPLWKSLWTRPVPGTLVWRRAEPFLMLDEEARGLDLNGAPVELLVEQLSSKAPAAAQLRPLAFAGCTRHGEVAWTPESKALKPCTDAVEKKFAKQRAEVARLRAKPGPEAREAQEKLDRAIDEEHTKKCGKLEEKIARQFGEVHAQLAADFAARPIADSIDRVGALQARLGIKATP